MRLAIRHRNSRYVKTGGKKAGGAGFDLAGASEKVGAPSFAVFAKGGSEER